MAAGIAGSGFNGLLALMDLLNDSIADDLREEPYASVMAEFSNSAAVFRLLGDPERMNEVKETFAQVDELVTGFFQKYPKEELYVEGQKLRLLIGTVNGPQELSESEQLNDRDWFRTINDTGRGR
jgi:crotonobetainyl-CoA:carnitine CoA-transferase CaiB-like acyl-CoA transferase